MAGPVPRSTSSDAPPSTGAPPVTRSRTLQGRGRPGAGLSGAPPVPDSKPRRPRPPPEHPSVAANGARMDRSRSVNTGSSATLRVPGCDPPLGRPAHGAPASDAPGVPRPRPARSPGGSARQPTAVGASTGWPWVRPWGLVAARPKGVRQARGGNVPAPAQEGAPGRGTGARAARGERRDSRGGKGMDQGGAVPSSVLLGSTLVGLSSSFPRGVPEEDELDEAALAALAGVCGCARSGSYGGAADTGALAPPSPPAVPLTPPAPGTTRGGGFYPRAGRHARAPAPAGDSAGTPPVDSAWRQWRLSRQLTVGAADVELMKGFLAHPEAWATLEESPANRFYVFEYLQNVRANHPQVLQEFRSAVVGSRQPGRGGAEAQLGALRREALQLLALLFSDQDGLWRLRRQHLLDLIRTSEHWGEEEEDGEGEGQEEKEGKEEGKGPTEAQGRESESESQSCEPPAPETELVAAPAPEAHASAPDPGTATSPGGHCTAEDKHKHKHAARGEPAPAPQQDKKASDVTVTMSGGSDDAQAPLAEGDGSRHKTAGRGDAAEHPPLCKANRKEVPRAGSRESGESEGLDTKREEQGTQIGPSVVPHEACVAGQGECSGASAPGGNTTGAGSEAPVSASEAYRRLTAAFAARDRELLRAFLENPGQWDSLLLRTPMHARFLATLREMRQGQAQGQGQGEEVEGLRAVVRGLEGVRAEDIRGLNLGALQVLALVLGDSPRVTGLSREELVRICLTCGPWGGGTPPRSTSRGAAKQGLALPVGPRGSSKGRPREGEAQGECRRVGEGQSRGDDGAGASVKVGAPTRPSLPALVSQASMPAPPSHPGVSKASIPSPLTPKGQSSDPEQPVCTSTNATNSPRAAEPGPRKAHGHMQNERAPALVVLLEEEPGQSLGWEASGSCTQGSSSDSSSSSTRSSSSSSSASIRSSSSSSSSSRSSGSSGRLDSRRSADERHEAYPWEGGRGPSADEGMPCTGGMAAHCGQELDGAELSKHQWQETAACAQGEEGADPSSPEEEKRAETGAGSSWVHPFPRGTPRSATAEGGRGEEQPEAESGEEAFCDSAESKREGEMDAIGRIEKEALAQVQGEEEGLRQRLRDEEAALEAATRAAQEARQALESAQQLLMRAEARVAEVHAATTTVRSALLEREGVAAAVRAKAAACRTAWQRHVVATQRLALPLTAPGPWDPHQGARRRQGDLEAAAQTHHEFLRLWEELMVCPAPPQEELEALPTSTPSVRPAGAEQGQSIALT